MFRYLFSRCADLSGRIVYSLNWEWLMRADERFWTLFPDKWFDQTDGSDAKHPGYFWFHREETDFELHLELPSWKGDE